MKTYYGVVQVQLYTFLTSAVDGHAGHFTPGKEPPGACWAGGFVGTCSNPGVFGEDETHFSVLGVKPQLWLQNWMLSKEAKVNLCCSVRFVVSGIKFLFTSLRAAWVAHNTSSQ
jgi:hypothetical protein